MSDSCDPANQFDCETLMHRPGGARVVMEKSAADEFWALERRQQAQLVAYMELWVDNRPLTDKQFNGNEGRVKSTNRMLKAFKIFKVRGYGIVLPLGGRKTFVIVDWDTSKKDNKAKPRILKRAKQRAHDFESLHGRHIK